MCIQHERTTSPSGLYGSVVLIAAGILSLSFVLPAQAQQSAHAQAFITWHADTYVPAGFPGKALPIFGSSVQVSLDVIDNSSFIDLSGQTIVWYQNGKFFKEGVGLTRVSIPVLGGAEGVIEIRTEVPSYRKQIDGMYTSIAITSPEIVIETANGQNTTREKILSLRGMPYFFKTTNPDSLLFSWSAAGRKPIDTENPHTLNVKLGADITSEVRISVVLEVRNSKDQYEFASGRTEIIFQP